VHQSRSTRLANQQAAPNVTITTNQTLNSDPLLNCVSSCESAEPSSSKENSVIPVLSTYKQEAPADNSQKGL
jgi:hypothetical protein